MYPTLVILAAGMGSRFGGNKQIEKLGPSCETIMDYSVFDAIRAGFGKVVFVIKNSFKDDFVNIFNKERFCNLIEVEYVFQETEYIPDKFSSLKNRNKPWGTAHALLMAESVINEPFASINADDFYGHEAFESVYNFLYNHQISVNQYCVMGYDIEKTLVKTGGTSRAECIKDEYDNLTFVEERLDVQSINGIIKGIDNQNNPVIFKPDSLVSMNFWGFTPDIFSHLHNYFNMFLNDCNDMRNAEFLIPWVINNLIKNQISTVKVLNSGSDWFGLTYQKDIDWVKRKILLKIQQGKYPEKLWI